jgi:hypothetical protein
VSAMSESGKYGPAHACAGIIGNVDFRVGSRAKGILEQHIILSGGRFRGIRNGATWHSDPSLRVFTSGSGEGLMSTALGARASPRWRRLISRSKRGCSIRSSVTWSTWPAPFPKPGSC